MKAENALYKISGFCCFLYIPFVKGCKENSLIPWEKAQSTKKVFDKGVTILRASIL